MFKNLLLFRGKNKIELFKTLEAWREKFVLKHGEFNLLEIRKELITNEILSDCMTSGFMGSSRMIIFPDMLLKTEKEMEKLATKEATKNEVIDLENLLQDDKRNSSKEITDDMWIAQLEKIPETNFCLFIGNPKPVTALEKWLEKNATIYDFPALEGPALADYIENMLKVSGYQAEKIAIRLNFDHDRSIQEVRKLQLAQQSSWTDEELKSIIPDYHEESIFELLDSLWANNAREVHKIWKKIAEKPDYERSAAGLMTMLRKILIVQFFPKALDIPVTPFHRNTAKRLANNKKNLKTLFDHLINADIKSKTGGLPERKNEILFALLEYCYN